MKRFLSLFLSLTLLVSMCTGTFSVSAANDDTYIVTPEVVVFDIIGRSDVSIALGTASGNKYIKYNDATNKAFHIYKSKTDPFIDTNILPGKQAIAFVYDGTGQPFVQMGNGISGVKSSGRKIFYKGKVCTTISTKPRWQILNDGNSISPSENLKANTWYEFNAVADLTAGVNKVSLTFTQILSDEEIADGVAPHTVSGSTSCNKDTFSYMRVRASASESTTYYTDVKFSYIDPPKAKASILSIGSDGEVAHGQSVVPFDLSCEIKGLSKDYISIVNKDTSEACEIESIAVANDGKHVDVTLSQELDGWAEYDLSILASVYGEGVKQVIGEGEETDVTDITSEGFITTKAPFATKGFEFTANGDILSARGLVVNTSGTPVDVKLVFSAFDAEGKQGVIESEDYPEFNNTTGEYLEASVDTLGAEKLNFFIINNWTDKTPLLGVNTVVDADGNPVEVQNAVSCSNLGGDEPVIIVNDFNHDTKELILGVDTKTNAPVTGIVFVYKKGEAVSDEKLPVYAGSVLTAEDGTMKLTLPLSLDDYGEYVVEFASDVLTENIKDDFKFYTPEELIEGRKSEILEAAKLSLTAAELKEAILGLDASGEKVNSNFDIFGADADVSDYELVLDTEKIFANMLSSISSVNSYDALVSLFEDCAKSQYQYELENPTIIIESAVTTVADTTQTVKYGSTTGNYSGTQALTTDSAKNHWIYATSNSNKQETYEITNDTSFGDSVVKFKRIYDAYLQIFFGGTIPSGKDIAAYILNKEKGTIEGEIRFTQDITPTWTVSPTGGIATKSSLGSSLKADTWYNFKWDVVTGSHIKVSFVEKLSDEDVAAGVTPHSLSKQWNYTSDTFLYFRFYPNLAEGESFYLDNIKMYYDLIPYEKAKITSVGTNGLVEHGQNSFVMTLSQKIPGLGKDHISVVNKDTGDAIAASAVSVDEATHTVNVTLESNLMGWTEYDVKIDKSAFGATALERVGKNEPVPVTDVVAGFETTKDSLAAKSFVFAGSAGNLNAKGLVANTSGTAKDINLVFASFDENGRIVKVEATEYPLFNNGDGEYLEANISTNGASGFNFFVIDNWTDKNHLFASYYNVDATGAYLPHTETVSGGLVGSDGAAIELGEFDYENIKISLKADTKTGKISDGVLFVYKTSETPTSSNLPVYAKAVSTSADGTAELEIILPSNLQYGEYTVEFNVAGVSLKENFNYYTPAELVELRKAEIVAKIKSCTSADELKEIILGVDSSGMPINDNYDFICNDADKVNYEKVEDTDKVFEKMLMSLSSLSDYNSFIALFDNSVKEVRTVEISNQRLVICSEAKASQTHGALRMIMLGINEKGETVNYNFEIISGDANMTNYNKVKSPDKVFTKMHSKLSQVTDYNSLIELFEKCAKEQYNSENESKSSPSSNNKGYGGSSVAVKETVDNPVVTAPESGNTTVSGSKFADMKSHWAESYVNELAERGIMNGYEDGSFRGDGGITRAELAKTLVEALELQGEGDVSYSDVASDSWYAPYVARAALAGVVKGYEDGSFAPDVKVTRQDAALMLYRAMSVGRTLPLGYTFFTDDLDIDNYASGAIRTLGDLGIVNGDDQKAFKPKNTITRAEVATIICRALDYIESH